MWQSAGEELPRQSLLAGGCGGSQLPSAKQLEILHVTFSGSTTDTLIRILFFQPPDKAGFVD